MFIPFSEWAPDSDETAPGMLVDCENLVPSVKGYKGAPTQVSAGIAALNAQCRGVTTVVLLDGTSVMMAGTQTELFKAGASTWTDITRTTPDYTGGSSSKWCFTQQGNLTLAVNKIDTPQKYLHGTDTIFANLTAMPKCAVAEAVGQFIMIGNYNDGTDTVDGWGCSAIGDYTNWTASVANQCVFGRLYDTPGPLTALRRLGDYAIYYKERSMYLARYVGAPTIWEFTLVSDIIGAVSNEAVVKIGQVHYFLGAEDFYAYDASSIQPLNSNMRAWFNNDCHNKYRSETRSVHDRKNGLVYWFYPSGSSTTPNAWVAYSYKSNKWGKGSMDVEVCAEYVTGSRTYTDMLALFPTYADYGSSTYSALNITPGTPQPSVFDTAHTLQILNGVCDTSSLTTNDYGIDDHTTLIRRVRPRYLQSPSAATMTNYYRDSPGDSLTTDVTTTQASGKIDVLRTARWHRATLNFTGDVEVSGIDVDAIPAGME